jgi:hypothetical protein
MNICYLPYLYSLYTTKCRIQSIPAINKFKRIDAVRQWFTDCNPRRLNIAFLTLFTNYNQIMLVRGMNSYKIKNKGKQRLERAGDFPTVINVVQLDDVQYEEEEVNGDWVGNSQHRRRVGGKFIWVVPPLGLLGDGL